MGFRGVRLVKGVQSGVEFDFLLPRPSQELRASDWLMSLRISRTRFVRCQGHDLMPYNLYLIPKYV